MQISATGGIFARLDSSGLLNFYNSSGTSLAKFLSGGQLASKFNSATASLTGSDRTTTSGTAVSSGAGVTITPTTSNNILVLVAANAASTVSLDQFGIFAYRNTTGVPTSGTGVGSDTLVGSISLITAAANQQLGGAIAALDTGLTLGTAYSYYMALRRVAGTGTISLLGASQSTIVALET